MSRIAELAAKLAADKSRSDELEASMASTAETADQLADSFTTIGAEGKAAQISEVRSQLGQARNTRWLAEGHLEDALTVLQAAMDGQQGAGAGSQSSTATSTANDNATGSETSSLSEPEGSHSFTTDLDGQPVKVTIVPPQPEHEPGPAGEALVEEASERRGSFSRSARTAVQRFDDIAGNAKKITNTQYDAARALNPPPTQTNAVTQQPQDIPQFTSPRGDVNIGDAVSAGLALSVFALAAVGAKRDARKRKKE